MCVLLSLLLVLLLAYYVDAVLASYGLFEQVETQWVMTAQGWSMLADLWPLMLFGMMLGVLLTLGVLKWKKVL